MPEKPLTLSKLRAIQKWPCDGVVRFHPKRLKVGLCYSDAYDQVFQDAGGTYVGEKRDRCHTRDSVRRLTILNQVYLGSPGVRLWMQLEHVKKIIIETKPATEMHP